MNEGRKRNLTMLTDFYELTMANGYFQNGFADRIAYFDLFFRKVDVYKRQILMFMMEKADWTAPVKVRKSSMASLSLKYST